MARGVSATTFRETTVVSFVPCFYFLFLTVVAAVIIGLFNISERVRQYPNTRIERNVIATKKEPRLFMFAPKTKHGLPASKTANSASAPTARADLHCMSPLLAQSGHHAAEFQCLLLGVKRTCSDVPQCPLLTQSGHERLKIDAVQTDM